ncbi:hypothetical protein FNF29_01388 [Cafeteria roenbergensis]|uniref:G-protein coupled receptors family 3 profile domain-containing protein n=1 Tax=Cafeteria roenbergensis TaxID=33653 RepID=A0A5A8CTD9_CAFRO|nr:hypothetical protein FNF29_01388 [Cafeteria roenbergensis]|eukprot:KAA0155969.1 hypothetical protein FNF29_01388 [Cafeteria roenbergensis]
MGRAWVPTFAASCLGALIVAASGQRTVTLAVGVVVTGPRDESVANGAAAAADAINLETRRGSGLAFKDGAGVSARLFLDVVRRRAASSSQADVEAAALSLVGYKQPLGDRAHVLLSAHPRFAKTISQVGAFTGVPVFDVATPSTALGGHKLLTRLRRREAPSVASQLAAILARDRAKAVAVLYAGNDPMTVETCTAVLDAVGALGVAVPVTIPYYVAFRADDDDVRWHWESGLAPGNPIQPSALDGRTSAGMESDLQLLTQAAQLVHDSEIDHVVVCGFYRDAGHFLSALANTNRPLRSIVATPAALQPGFADAAAPMADWVLGAQAWHESLRWEDSILNSSALDAVGRTTHSVHGAGGVTAIGLAASQALTACQLRTVNADAIFPALENASAVSAAAESAPCLASYGDVATAALVTAAWRLSTTTVAGPLRFDSAGLNTADPATLLVQLQPAAYVERGTLDSVPGVDTLSERVALPAEQASSASPKGSLVFPIPGVDYLAAGSVSGTIVLSISWLLAAGLSALAVVFVMHRSSASLSASGIWRTIVLLAGLACLALYPTQFVGIPTQGSCTGRDWLLGFGIILTLLPLAARTWYRWQAVIEPLMPERVEGLTDFKFPRWLVIPLGVQVTLGLIGLAAPPRALRGSCFASEGGTVALFWVMATWQTLLWVWLARLVQVASFVPDPLEEARVALVAVAIGGLAGLIAMASAGASQSGAAQFSSETAAVLASTLATVFVVAVAVPLSWPKFVAFVEEAKERHRASKLAPEPDRDEAEAVAARTAGAQPTGLDSNEKSAELARPPGTPLAGRRPGTGKPPPHAKELDTLRLEVERLKEALAIANGQAELMRLPVRDTIAQSTVARQPPSVFGGSTAGRPSAAGSDAGGLPADEALLREVADDVPEELAHRLKAANAALEAARSAPKATAQDSAATAALDRQPVVAANDPIGLAAVRVQVRRVLDSRRSSLQLARARAGSLLGAEDDVTKAVLVRTLVSQGVPDAGGNGAAKGSRDEWRGAAAARAIESAGDE